MDKEPAGIFTFVTGQAGYRQHVPLTPTIRCVTSGDVVDLRHVAICQECRRALRDDADGDQD